jgi:biopolymer transport protein TolR
MAGSFGNGGGYGGNGRRRTRYRPLAEINVTPLVDVMLVLLIVFMVTAPLMTNAINVDLPKVATGSTAADSKPLTVSIDAQGQVFLQDQKLELAELVGKLQAISEGNLDRRIAVRGNKDVQYGRIAEVMGAIILGGFTKAALVTEPPVLGAGAPAGAPAVAPAGKPPGKGG